MIPFPQALEGVKPQLIATLIAMISVMLIRFLASRALKRSRLSSQALRLKWKVQLRTGSYLLFVLLLLFIWGSQLHSMLLSMLAVLAAIVLATKELILCLTGSVLKASSGSFTLGDCIQLGTSRGIVIDQGLLSTTLQECAGTSQLPTGKTLTLPNSLFLSQAVLNETRKHFSTCHEFKLLLKNEQLTEDLEKGLMAILNKNTESLLPKSTKEKKRKGSLEHLNEEDFTPAIRLQQQAPDILQMGVTCQLPVKDIPLVEQELIRCILSHTPKKEANSEKA